MRISHPYRAILLAGWMVFIFLMSAQPDSGAQSGFLVRLLLGPIASQLSPDQLDAAHHLLRKAAHFSEFALLALLWVWNLGTSPARLVLAWVLSALYAGTDEWHQAFTPHRGPSPWDVALDSAGAFAMIAVVRIWVYARRDVARPAVPGPVPGVPPPHALADMPAMLGGDPAGSSPRD